MSEILLERLNVNDDEHMLVGFLVEDGSHVEKGTPVAEVETSKAAVELEAPESGPIHFVAKPGQVLKVGAPVYHIGAAPAPAPIEPPIPSPAPALEAETAAPEADTPGPGDEPSQEPRPPHPGFFVDRPYQAPKPPRGMGYLQLPPGAALPVETVAARPKPYVGDDPRKAAEVANLSVVNPSGLVSCLFARCAGTRRRVAQDGLFETNFSDLIIYETARLLRKYPNLNAWYDPDAGLQLHAHAEIGYSIDVSDDLTVYNLGACETLSLPEIRNALEGAMEAHVTKKISRQHLKPTTLTVTDLSGSGVGHFFPLINGQQSAIIGYGSEPDGSILLSLSFDHRAMGGRYVAQYLAELVDRLNSHLTTGAAPEEEVTVECDFCGRDAETLRKLRQRGLMRILTPSGEDALCCETCFTTT